MENCRDIAISDLGFRGTDIMGKTLEGALGDILGGTYKALMRLS